MAQIKKILVVCGEASGDLHAGNLVASIKGRHRDVEFLAVGGAHLRQAGANICYDIKDLSCLGFFDVLNKLPRFFRLKDALLQKIKQEKIDAVILVDFSGFNLRLAKSINKSIPVVYYISPQVWASRQGRVKTIQRYIHKMLVLFKFEVEFYKQRGVDAQFVGHPLLDIVKPAKEENDFRLKSGLSDKKTTFALLPGSRVQEVKHILPAMIKALSFIQRKEPSLQAVIAKSSQVDMAVYQELMRGATVDLKIVEGLTYDCLKIADFSFVASGTATLESAIIGKPFAVIYKMGLLNYLLYRPQVKVPFIGIVNIVGGKYVVPEFIQFNATGERIAKYVLGFLSDNEKKERMSKELSRVKSLLGDTGATLRASRIISDFLQLQ